MSCIHKARPPCGTTSVRGAVVGRDQCGGNTSVRGTTAYTAGTYQVQCRRLGSRHVGRTTAVTPCSAAGGWTVPQSGAHTQALRHRRCSIEVGPVAQRTGSSSMGLGAVQEDVVSINATEEVVDSAAAAAAGPPLFGAGTKGRVVVVGAGLAGVLAASLFAKKGYQVAVFEKRDGKLSRNTRSFPMGLGWRAVKALGAAGLDPGLLTNHPINYGFTVLGGGTPMLPSYMELQYLVDRVDFGQELLAAAQQQYPKEISFHFGYTVSGLDLAGRTLKVTPSVEGVVGLGVDEVPYDLLVAADGSFSRVRELCEQQDPSLEVSIPFVSGSCYFSVSGLPAVPNLPWDVDKNPDPTRKGTYLRRLKPKPNEPTLLFWPTPDGTFSALSGGWATSPTGPTPWVRELMQARQPPNAEQLAEMQERLQDNLAQIPEEWQQKIVQQLPDIRFSLFGRVVCCNKLSCPGVVMLGDAAHAVTSVLGQGGTLAVEDVSILGKVLEDVEGQMRPGGAVNGAPAQTEAAVMLGDVAVQYERQRMDDVRAMQMCEMLSCEALGHKPPPKLPFLAGLVHSWQRLAVAVSSMLGFNLFAIVPAQRVFLPMFVMMHMPMSYGQVFRRCQVQMAVLLALVGGAGGWLGVAAGRWALTAAGLA